MGNCGSGAANRADDGADNGPDEGAANRAAAAAVTTAPAPAQEAEKVAIEAADQDAENRADHGAGNRTWYYELAGDGLGEKLRRGHVAAASDEPKDVLSAIVRKEWILEVEAFGRTIQFYATLEDMNNGADPLNERERLAGNIGNQNFPLIAKICNVLSEGRKDRYGEGTFYATGGDVWDWVKEPWAGSIPKIKRFNTPDIYKDLVTGITKSEGLVFEELTVGRDPQTNITEQVSDVKCLNGTKYSILGNLSCNKGHFIAKSPTCRWFYGPVGMIAVGLEGANEIPSPDIWQVWKKLLWGGQALNKHKFLGLEKRVENMLMMNNPHQEFYDTLTKGVCAVIPLCDANFCQNWEQGQSYDVLVVVDNAETAALVLSSNNTFTRKCHREAFPDEIEKATMFLGDCIKALAEILDSDRLIEPMNDFLQKFDNKAMCATLDSLVELRDALRAAGGVDVPTKNPGCDKVVLKVDMKAFLQLSKVGVLDSGLYPSPDPWLLGMKAAINAYFMLTKKKLVPACLSSNQESEDEDSQPFSQMFPNLSSSYEWPPAFRNRIRDLASYRMPEEVAYVNESEDNISVVTCDYSFAE